MKIDKGAKVYFSGRKTPYRVIGFTKLNDEKAVELIRQSDYTDFNRFGRKAVQVARTIAVADLVRDTGRRGWRERWVQLDLEMA